MPDLDTLLSAAPRYPERIVCMTEETTETLYRIGLGDRVVGVSGFTKRPPEARKKPKISTFLEAKYDEILDLKPDLVLGFSDLQAELARDLAKLGVPVFLFNQRSVAEILQTVRVIGAIAGAAEAAEALAAELEANLRAAAARGNALAQRPRVFFEEWDDPLIAGIRWVSELIEICGGDDVCRDRRTEQGAKGRIVDPDDIAARDPEIILGSWCGKKMKKDVIRGRKGWDAVTAVRNDAIHEIEAELILQPGPAALSDALPILCDHLGA